MNIIPFQIGSSCINVLEYDYLPILESELKTIADFVAGKKPFGIRTTVNEMVDKTGRYPMLAFKIDHPHTLDTEETSEALVTWTGKLAKHLPSGWNVINEKMKLILGKHPDTHRTILIFWVVFSRRHKQKNKDREESLSMANTGMREYWQ